jgi:hypothetical protein
MHIYVNKLQENKTLLYIYIKDIQVDRKADKQMAINATYVILWSVLFLIDRSVGW